MSGVSRSRAYWNVPESGLIVSCQALPEEPLHSSYIMGRMALQQRKAGRQESGPNTVERSITEIKKTVDLPAIGIHQEDYRGLRNLYHPNHGRGGCVGSMRADIIALDCTRRLRPGNRTLDDFFAQVRLTDTRNSYSWQTALIMKRECMRLRLTGLDRDYRAWVYGLYQGRCPAGPGPG